MVVIKIETENAAFEDKGEEVARILRQLAARVQDASLAAGDAFPLFDLNGNACGTFQVTK